NIHSNKEDIITTNTKREAIFQALSVVMASKNRPTAICAATDSIAIYIMDYLIEKGYRIPEDISVIGIDNVYLSSHQSFKLTTVGLTVDQNLGRIGIETLIKQIEKGNIHSDFMQKTIPAKLIVRETTREI